MPSPVREAIDLLSKSGQAAFAIDSTDRLVYWNKGCEDLLGDGAQKVLGKFCHEVMGGRDENGNQYCYRNCPVANQARTDEDRPVQPFVLTVNDKAGNAKRLTVSMFAVPAVRPSLSAVIHVIRQSDAPETPLEKIGRRLEAPEQKRPVHHR